MVASKGLEIFRNCSQGRVSIANLSLVKASEAAKFHVKLLSLSRSVSGLATFA
ncbi:hypothetical protein Syun_014109 [Stephania yunnanensis]|uniref:Uncharacterized protein n=1 Tax=Stephania yunnanensis TaxID=152371 RepID=A0AAP0JJ48_9MAGN